jgi:hypothetical protein
MKTRKITAALVATFMVVTASALPAQAAGVKYQVSGSISGANGKTVLLIANTGKVLGSQAISKSPATLKITSNSKTSNLSGATLQLVTTSGGDYYGPVVLGWSSKTKVYTQFGTKPTSKGKYTVGNLSVKGVTTLQGYAKAAKSLSPSKKYVKNSVTKAINYKPVGVGTYGKAPGGTNAQAFMSNLRNFSGASLIGDFDIRNAIAEDQKFDGGDADGDGLPNAFDVNDDGDGKLDQAEAQNQQIAPTPELLQKNCEAQASFNIFTNFKSTAQNFTGNLNYYGTGEFQATDERIASALSNTMSIVMQPITSVCGSNVTKSEFKGVGTLPYAPADYVDISSVPTSGPGTTGDYQWTVGNGKIGNTTIAGLAPFTFTSPKQISGQDVLMQRVTTADGKVYEFAGTMGFVFVTHPVPLSYSTDGTNFTDITFNGNRATYGSLVGTETNFIPISVSTKLWIKFAVPQRLAFDGETVGYWDLGNMTYTPDVPNGFGGGQGPGKCDSLQSIDSTGDSAVTSSARTFAMVFTLGDCFTAKSKSWGTGAMQGGFDIQVVPSGGGGNSAQKLGVLGQ